jgi:diguanylate cyclase (GGDEF)-like protein
LQNTLVGLLLLVIILYFFWKQQGSVELADRLFLSLVVLNAVLLLLEFSVDLFGIYYPRPSNRTMVSLLTALFYLLNPAPGVLYFLYVSALINRQFRVKSLFIAMVVLPFAFHAVFALVSPFTGWLFTISQEGIYQRGPWFFLMVICNYSYLAAGPLYLSKCNTQLQRKLFSTLLVFPFPVAIAGLLQTMFYGLEVLWLSLAFSLLILFFNVETFQVSRDFLTGLYNRRYFQKMVGLAFEKHEGNLPVWVILIDINGFKKVNDTYGHEMGDAALVALSRLLEQSFIPDAVISRFGGDEFALLVPLAKPLPLSDVLAPFKNALTRMNRQQTMPFELSVSVGCCNLAKTTLQNVHQFLLGVDKVLYQAKRKAYELGEQEHCVVSVQEESV